MLNVRCKFVALNALVMLCGIQTVRVAVLVIHIMVISALSTPSWGQEGLVGENCKEMGYRGHRELMGSPTPSNSNLLYSCMSVYAPV